MDHSFALAALALVTCSAPHAAQVSNPKAQALFLKNCATCHGEKGDGHGTTQLDRPARSFLDGGFSFGNTPEALFRTLSVGIPGTPMPGFDTSIEEEDRRLLAAYVVTLGPPVEEVALEDTILAVHDRTLVVRGLLPPIADELPQHPRGLLVGDPSGITFEYRVDDVRLLGLRQGGFVRRTDWTGRGGTALEPLGKVVQLIEGGKPGSFFARGGAERTPLVARLSATAARGPSACLEYHLLDGQRELAHVTETPGVLTTPFGTGYSRRFELIAGSSPADLWIQTPNLGEGRNLHTSSGPEALAGVCQPAQGGPVWVALRFTRQPTGQDHAAGRLTSRAHLEPGQRLELEYTNLALTEWNDSARHYLEASLKR